MATKKRSGGYHFLNRKLLRFFAAKTLHKSLCQKNKTNACHLSYSEQVAQLQCQGQQRHRAEATSWNGCPALLTCLHIQKFCIAAKEQDGIDIRKQGNER
eukprot:2432167-Amphidinium_carterae.1